MATIAQPTATYRSDQAFFVKLAIFLSVLIVFSFAQNAALGRVDLRTMPLWVHLHALLMLAWLGLFVTQNRLAAAGNLALHRKLGWLAAYLVVGIVALSSFAGIMALKRHAVPPFYSDAHFLALTQTDAVVFGGLVFAAITRRTETEYHRRLMMGATIMILDPALGRLLPMPLMGGWGDWAVLAVQLVLVGMIALHDRRILGRIHPATATSGAIIAMAHVFVTVAGYNPEIAQIAASIAAG
ncbi:MAG: adenylate cyclase [Novosphingobium sp.]